MESIRTSAVDITIDGETFQAERRRSLLDVALGRGLEIPHLCHHPAVRALGSCRLCLVEVTTTAGDRTRSTLTTACDFPVMPGLVVVTRSERIQRVRRGVIELLLARAGDSARIRELAREHGVEDPGYARTGSADGCVLCGLCVTVCRDVVGVEALGFVGRGDRKEVRAPFGEPSRECIGCASCASVCPTGCIEVVDEGLVRRLPRWNAVHELVRCRLCGRPVATRKHLQYLSAKLNQGADHLAVCTACRRRFYAGRVALEGHM